MGRQMVGDGIAPAVGIGGQHRQAQRFERQEIIDRLDREAAGLARSEGRHAPFEEAADLFGRDGKAGQIVPVQPLAPFAQGIGRWQDQQAARNRRTIGARPGEQGGGPVGPARFQQTGHGRRHTLLIRAGEQPVELQQHRLAALEEAVAAPPGIADGVAQPRFQPAAMLLDALESLLDLVEHAPHLVQIVIDQITGGRRIGRQPGLMIGFGDGGDVGDRILDRVERGEDAMAEAIGVGGGRDGRIILQQQLLDEILEIMAQPAADAVAFHHPLVDVAQRAQHAAQIAAEAGRIARRLVQAGGIFPRIALQRFQLVLHLDDKAAKLVGQAFAQAAEKFGQAHGAGRHVDRDLQAIAAFLDPAGSLKPVVDMPGAHHRRAGRLRVGGFQLAPAHAAARSRGQLVQHHRAFILAPQLRIVAQQRIDQLDDLTLGREMQVGTVEAFIEADQHALVEKAVRPGEQREDIGMELAEQHQAAPCAARRDARSGAVAAMETSPVR